MPNVEVETIRRFQEGRDGYEVVTAWSRHHGHDLDGAAATYAHDKRQRDNLAGFAPSSAIFLLVVALIAAVTCIYFVENRMLAQIGYGIILALFVVPMGLSAFGSRESRAMTIARGRVAKLDRAVDRARDILDDMNVLDVPYSAAFDRTSQVLGGLAQKALDEQATNRGRPTTADAWEAHKKLNETRAFLEELGLAWDTADPYYDLVEDGTPVPPLPVQVLHLEEEQEPEPAAQAPDQSLTAARAEDEVQAAPPAPPASPPVQEVAEGDQTIGDALPQGA